MSGRNNLHEILFTFGTYYRSIDFLRLYDQAIHNRSSLLRFHLSSIFVIKRNVSTTCFLFLTRQIESIQSKIHFSFLSHNLPLNVTFSQLKHWTQTILCNIFPLKHRLKNQESYSSSSSLEHNKFYSFNTHFFFPIKSIASLSFWITVSFEL